nr:MAG TPA: hypothetical protein [Caudoviricetes sp.]
MYDFRHTDKRCEKLLGCLFIYLSLTTSVIIASLLREVKWFL